MTNSGTWFEGNAFPRANRRCKFNNRHPNREGGGTQIQTRKISGTRKAYEMLGSRELCSRYECLSWSVLIYLESVALIESHPSLFPDYISWKFRSFHRITSSWNCLLVFICTHKMCRWKQRLQYSQEEFRVSFTQNVQQYVIFPFVALMFVFRVSFRTFPRRGT